MKPCLSPSQMAALPGRVVSSSVRALFLVALMLTGSWRGPGLPVCATHLLHHLPHHLAAWTLAAGRMLARRRTGVVRSRLPAGPIGRGRRGRGRRLPVRMIRDRRLGERRGGKGRGEGDGGKENDWPAHDPTLLRHRQFSAPFGVRQIGNSPEPRRREPRAVASPRQKRVASALALDPDIVSSPTRSATRRGRVQ